MTIVIRLPAILVRIGSLGSYPAQNVRPIGYDPVIVRPSTIRTEAAQPLSCYAIATRWLLPSPL